MCHQGQRTDLSVQAISSTSFLRCGRYVLKIVVVGDMSRDSGMLI